MSNKFKSIDIKDRTYYLFDDMVNIKNHDPSKISEQMKSDTKYSYYTGYETVKDLRYVKINSVNPLYLVINKINGYFEESNGTLKNRTKELWTKIRDLIRSKTNDSDNYDEKYMKIKFNQDDDSSLNKTLELFNMGIVVFHKGNKYFPQVFQTNVCINYE